MKAVIYDSVIKNWLIVNADTSFHADVAIRDGKIVALWKGLAYGIINVVATDHCPFLFKTEKSSKDDFTKIPKGYQSLRQGLY